MSIFDFCRSGITGVEARGSAPVFKEYDKSQPLRALCFPRSRYRLNRRSQFLRSSETVQASVRPVGNAYRSCSLFRWRWFPARCFSAAGPCVVASGASGPSSAAPPATVNRFLRRAAASKATHSPWFRTEIRLVTSSIKQK